MNFEYERLSVTVKNDFVNLDARLIKYLLFLDRRQPVQKIFEKNLEFEILAKRSPN